MAARQPTRLTYAEYLQIEARTGIKHEYVDGLAYPMAGGTLDHAGLSAAMVRALGNALEGRPCRVFSSDLKVRIPPTGDATYPDVTVVCGKAEVDVEDRNAVVNPRLIVEVLSDATEAYDRGQKFDNYRELPSLREYVLVSQGEPRIEVYRRNETGGFDLVVDARAGGHVVLETTGQPLSVDAVYLDPLA